MGHKIIDLSQEIFTGVPVWIGHPPTEVTYGPTHEETRASGRFTENYSYMSEKISMSTHGTTHVDSISHIDPTPGAPSIEKIPLAWFYTEAICLNLTHVPPKSYYTVEMIQAALAKDGLEVKKGDTVLLYSGHYGRTFPTPAYPPITPA
jgi:kynurenine formamidase